MADAASVAENVAKNGAPAAGAAVVCVNSIAQIGFANELLNLGNEASDGARQTAMADFNQRFSNHVTTLQAEAIKLSKGMEGVRASLGDMESLKKKAERKINHAMWLIERKSPAAAEFNTFLDAREETAFRRYTKAHENAKRMAFLAKRAVEQRLGVRLSDMRDDLPLVEAPQTWESTVCATSGIDLEALSTDAEGNSTGTKDFSDAFIGEYVRNLENVVESYSLAHNFHEGDDFVVASLRDDILGVRTECSVESHNLLHYSSQLDHHSLDATDVGRWSVDGCAPADGESAQECLAVMRLDVSPTSAIRNSPALRGHQLILGDDFLEDAALRQRVPVPAGMYLFSWYSPVEDGEGAFVGKAWLADETAAPAETATKTEHGDLWDRHWFVFQVNEPQEIAVGFLPDSLGFQVGAPMLERVSSKSPGNLVPRPYSDTSETRLVTSPSCQDSNGETFRQEYWTRGCVNLCVDGYSSECTGGEKRCYYETHFSLTQRQLAKGEIFSNAGFAEGNFNYRIGDMGVNFVGTGIRDCAESETPSGCYSNGFVQYSLYHEGPFHVRNHWGEDYEALLFPGRVERARGLASERYLSNPLGSADAGLMDQYQRSEFSGRPLDGIFRIRVWEGEGVDFERIEDIQLLLNYRYWTRFD